ncbi:MAG: XdhC family protein [Acidobacteriota bacterium]|nr:XdhC family protein [Acidobacteriota bacterium]
MRDLADALRSWRDAGTSFAVATVVKTWGSAPRPLGSKMAVSSDGEILGSVSGGCVEAAVAEEGRAAIGTGASRLLRFGVSDETAWQVGLSCGGRIEIFVEPYCLTDLQSGPRGEILDLLLDRLRDDRLTALATIVDGDGIGRQLMIGSERESLGGTLGSPSLDRQAIDMAEGLIAGLSSARRPIDIDGNRCDIFFDLHVPRPKLVIIGAVHVAAHLTTLASHLGFSTVVIDPRTAFATAERFAEADRLCAEWPQAVLPDLPVNETTCFVFLSHDPKIDLPGLQIALQGPALYVGALGSKKTHAKRIKALQGIGLSAEQIGRIHAPIGLDLGGRRAEEIALSIMAEILAVRYGRG